MNFDAAFATVVLAEGGYSDDPDDPGGKTKFGLSDGADGKIDGQAFGLEIREVSLPEVKAIYKDRYWHRTRCDELPWPLALYVFDAAVNQGPGAAAKLLQKAAGVKQDGVIGRKTMAAINAADQEELCCLFMADRALRYFGTRHFDKYGRGWLKRLFFVMRNSDNS